MKLRNGAKISNTKIFILLYGLFLLFFCPEYIELANKFDCGNLLFNVIISLDLIKFLINCFINATIEIDIIFIF